MPFLLDSNPEPSELSEAVNYLLSNFSTGITSDVVTGQITGPTGKVIGYLYQYMAVKYADSFDGSLNFSNSPTNRLYYGIRNTNDPAESSNPADYIWYKISGGFGVTKSLWFICTGGRQIQFAASVAAPDAGWLIDPGSSIDLDVVTSGTVPVIADTFVPYFTPAVLQVPRTGNPLTPSFSAIAPVMYATDKGAVVPFVDAQTDTAVGFVNNTWRIGNSATTGFGDISYTNITIGNPTDAGDYAQWPNPTAMSNSPAYITVPVRYKNSSGAVSQAGVATLQLVFVDPGQTGQQGSSVDISGYTSFVQNAGGAFTPPSATLSAVIQNITSPTYSWTITGATPTSSTASSVVVTPNSSATKIDVSLTVNGSNLISPITKTISMPVVYDGVAGQAGANGMMSAFPTIYIWTGSSIPPTRPSTTSTYTWSNGAYTAPSGWSTQAPSNTIAGNYLWSITVPLTVTATTTSSTLDWTNVAYPIRAIAYNGANGANGTNGTNGTNGLNGAATFVITRFANDSSPPTNTEVNAILGRNPAAGDVCTVSYNNYNNAVVYQYITSWTLFQTYITGSLIVQNTITADKMVANLMSADNVLTRGLTVRDGSGNIILSSGNALSGTYIQNAAITEAKIASAAVTNAKIANAAITNAKIGTAEVGTLSIAGNAVTVTSFGSAVTSGVVTITTSWLNLASTTFTVSGLSSGQLAGSILTAYTTLYENGGANAVIETGIFINGILNTTAGCTLGESKTNTVLGYVDVPNGTFTVNVAVRTSPASGGASTKTAIIVSGITCMSGKR